MKKLLWPGMLIALIGSSVIVHVVMLVVAASDHSFAVDAGAGRDEAWLERTRQLAENRRLGWTLSAELAASAETGASTRIVVTLRDDDDAEIDDAVVDVRAYHKAWPNDVATARLERVAPGRYATRVAATRVGHWALEVSAVRGLDRFVVDVDAELADADGEDVS